MKDELVPDDMDNLRGRRRGRLEETLPNVPTPPNVQSYVQSQGRQGRQKVHGKQEMQEGHPNLSDVNELQTTVCNIDEIGKGRIVNYRTPPQSPGITPPVPPGGTPTEQSILAEHLIQMNTMLDRNNNLLQQISDYLSTTSPTGTWFETQVTSSVATPPNAVNPNQDPNNLTDGINPGYDEVEVNKQLQGRNAQKLWLVNDGLVPTGVNTGSDVFVITSTDGSKFSPEFRVAFGEVRIINDVYDFRFRCSVAGNFIRASEREIQPPYIQSIIVSGGTVVVTANRPGFITRRLTLGIVDSTITVLVGATITIPNGFALSMIANVNNAGQVYISDSDATVAANRTTLAAGDVRSLFVTNTDGIHVAGSVAGQFLDIMVEQ
jgi:hypothetical protein